MLESTAEGRRSSERSRSGRSRSSLESVREIDGEPAVEADPAAAAEEAEEEKLYVALDKDVKEGMSNFLWVLQNTHRGKKIVILHVHSPAQKINIMGAWFRVDQLREEEVEFHRRAEKQKMYQCLQEYVDVCMAFKTQRAEILVIEKDDVGKGLVELIALNGITKLVMGAAADKYFSRKLQGPKSRAAITVQQKADPSCKVWFVCKGNLICTRDAALDGYATTHSSPSASIRLTPRLSEQLRSMSLGLPELTLNFPPNPAQESLAARSRSVNYVSHAELMPSVVHLGRTNSANRENTSTNDAWDVMSRSSQSSERSSERSGSDEGPNTNSMAMLQKEEKEEGSSYLTDQEDRRFLSQQNDLEDAGPYDDIYEKLQNALLESEHLKSEAYEECRRRQKAERNLNEAIRKVKVAESLYTKELKQRKEIEEKLEKEKLEVTAFKKQRDEVCKELEKAKDQRQTLERQIADSDLALKDIKGKLTEAHFVLNSIRLEHEALRRERDNVARENEHLRQKETETSTSTSTSEKFLEFSYSELKQVTDDFHESRKIGEGGYGTVYKGFLGHTAVAIKRLNPEGMQGTLEFYQEMNVLRKVRHPNLVKLVGACPEAWALVYEFLPNGSLEDRLTCRGNTAPLTWQARTRIAAEICSALRFLHTCEPHTIVHGDLKPANILLDADLVSKLGDFGICRFLVQSVNTTTLYHCTRQPKGTLAYMDPELFLSGEITARSDVYSFGVILLRLLTGRPPFGIRQVVQEKLEKRCLEEALDATAGDWPYVQAEQLAALGLRCCETSRKNRPNADEAWEILEPLARAAASFQVPSSSSFRRSIDDNSGIPSYFICPIRQELMRDPHIAADGFTYEAEAIRGWLDRGHDTSPMTNIKLSHRELVPNRHLCYAIEEWLQQQT